MQNLPAVPAVNMLDDDLDNDLIYGLASSSNVPPPASKIAGSRRGNTTSGKGKGKARQESPDSTKPPKHGRPYGSANFTETDIWALLKVMTKSLPLGDHGWDTVTKLYNSEAAKQGRQLRTQRTLQVKYKQVSNIFH
jgi:hypothetical protein